MKCDVCSQTTSPKRGYILTTAQVVHDPGYWKRAFGLLPASAEAMERGLPGVVRQMSGSETDWVLCEECMSYLKQDRGEAAKLYAEYVKTGRRPRLPDTGPADVNIAAIRASGAFEARYGRKPKTIQLPGASSAEVIGSEEFAKKFIALAGTGDREALSRLGEMQVRCGACGAVLPAMETRMTAGGMSCPRCDKPWFMALDSG